MGTASTAALIEYYSSSHRIFDRTCGDRLVANSPDEEFAALAKAEAELE